MIRGGYKIIDLKNKQLINGVSVVYEGIYDAIEGTRKPIIVSGMNIEGKEYGDIWVNFEINDTSYYFQFLNNNGDTVKITISDNDSVVYDSL